MHDRIRSIFSESIAIKRRFLRNNVGRIDRAARAIAGAVHSGHKLLLFGNGGSAADAQHIAAEFVNRYRKNRPPLPAIALTTDTSALTSIANDSSYRDVFVRQLEALGRPGDVAIGISTSGRSPNVVRALRKARQMGLVTVALTGGDGGPLGKEADFHLCVAGTKHTARIQETHIVVGHVLCELVEDILFGKGPISPRRSDTYRRRHTATSSRPR